MSATQNVAIKLSDQYNVYDDLHLPVSSSKSSVKSTLWFIINMIWESRFRIPTVIVLCIIAFMCGVYQEIRRGSIARRLARQQDSGWGNDDSDDDNDDDEDDDDDDGDDLDDDGSGGEYESDEDEGGEDMLFFPESMFIDPGVNPENDTELFNFIRRENPSYERSLMRRQPWPNEFQTELVLSSCPRIGSAS
nr:PREDICTED: cation channel sperm-associated protein 2-like [Bemisia tabaci]